MGTPLNVVFLPRMLVVFLRRVTMLHMIFRMLCRWHFGRMGVRRMHRQHILPHGVRLLPIQI